MEEEQESKKCPYCKELLEILDYRLDCEVKPDPIIMNLDYLTTFI